MMCVLCGNPQADKGSVYVAGEKTKLILGQDNPNAPTHIYFGICSDHLDENGDFLDVEAVKQAILRKVREPGVPKFDSLTDLNTFLENDQKDVDE